MANYETPIRPEGAGHVEERTELEPHPDYPHGDEGIPDFSVDETEEDPIGVYIVNSPPRTTDSKKCQLFNRPVDASQHTQLLGDNPDRERAVLRNTGAQTVLLTSEKEGIAAYGFELATGVELEITAQGEVWGRCATGETTTVSVLVEEWPRYTNG